MIAIVIYDAGARPGLAAILPFANRYRSRSEQAVARVDRKPGESEHEPDGHEECRDVDRLDPLVGLGPAEKPVAGSRLLGSTEANGPADTHEEADHEEEDADDIE